MDKYICMSWYARMLPLTIAGDGYWPQTSLTLLEVCFDFGAKFLALAPLILQDIWNGGVGIRFHVMSFQKIAYCRCATPTINIIGHMFIRHVCICFEVGDDGILQDEE